MTVSASTPALQHDAALWRVLAQQHLIEPAPGAALAAIADDLVGLHATSPATPVLSLHARVRGFALADLEDALYERRALVRLKAMRGTVFVFSRQMAPLVFAATRAATLASDRRWLGTSAPTYERLAPEVQAALAGQSLTVAELRKVLGDDPELAGVVGLLCDEGRIVRDRPISARSTTFRYRLWADAFPDVALDAWDETSATRELVRRYVDGYGPVSRPDVIWWTGLPAHRIDQALDALRDEVATTSVAGIGERFLMTRTGAARAAAGPEPRPGTVNLLPMLDPYTMGYKDRRRFLEPRLNDFVIDRGGNVTSVVLVDGLVAGVWDLVEEPSPAIRVLVFDPHGRQRSEILGRAETTAGFWFGTAVPVEEYTSMVPLRQRSGVMRRPLDGAQPRASALTKTGRPNADTHR